MSINISELMDSWSGDNIVLVDSSGVSVDRIKELSMKKINNAPAQRRRPIKIIALAAAIIAALGITAAAVADSWGFTDTSELSAVEIKALLDEAAVGHYTALVGRDGSVSYMYDGEVQFTLSADEAKLYEAERRAARQRTVRESTDKLDPDTMELFPNSITEIAVDGSGGFGDFILNNGNVVLLCAADGGIFRLEKGDTVRLTVSSGRACYARFGIVQDGKVLEEVSLHSDVLAHTFAIPADGEYCFTLGYYSVGADNFTNGKLVIE